MRHRANAWKFFLWVSFVILISGSGAWLAYACNSVATLTITYSWAPSSTVRINNTNVPAASLATAMNNWNASLNVTCFNPVFSTSSGTRTINMNFAPLSPDPEVPQMQ